MRQYPKTRKTNGKLFEKSKRGGQGWQMCLQCVTSIGAELGHGYSGVQLSNQEFCRQRGIPQKSFYYWLRKLRQQIVESAAPQLVPLDPVTAPEDLLHGERN